MIKDIYPGLFNSRISSMTLFNGKIFFGARLRNIHSTTSETGVELLVVLLPTKEAVFWERISRAPANLNEDVVRQLEAVHESERVLRADLLRFLGELQIPFVDTLPHFRDAEAQPFFGDDDSHPNAFGNLVIARAVADEMVGLNRQPRGSE